MTLTRNGGVGVNHLLLKDINNAQIFIWWKCIMMTHIKSQGVFGDGDNPDSVIYANNSEIYGAANGTLYPLTNRGVSGNLEDAGVSEIKILGGNRTVGPHILELEIF